MTTATAIVQARMGSTRLPGKVLIPLGDHLVIDWVVSRVVRTRGVPTIIVATTTDPEDDAIAAHFEGTNVAVVRGHPTDVLARFVAALELVETDHVVRVTADCPFVEPELIEAGLAVSATVDYVATGFDGRFARGLDVEVVVCDALRFADSESNDPVEREHVTPFIVRRPDRFTHAALPCPAWARHPDFRITLDEADDLRALRAIVAELDAHPETLHARDVTELLTRRDDLVDLNRNVAHNIVI